jgi:hypothetical protein
VTRRRRSFAAAAAGVALVLAALPAGAAGNLLQPFAASGSAPAAPWHVAGLPQQKKPFTRFSVVDVDGKRALRVDADESYGNLVHPLQLEQKGLHLGWRWRVDQLNTAADLRVREGDDTTLKVCALWDEPLDSVPFVERQLLRAARAKTGEALPAATVCYVWDAKLAEGTDIDSPFTRRLRYVVLRSGDRPRQWISERRDIGADFLRLFGAETTQLPVLIGVAVGADSDNTHTRSVGHVADLVLE